MATADDVKQLLLRVDASTQLAQRKLNEFAGDVEKGAVRTEKALQRISDSSRLAQQRSRLLGYQISDIGTQLAGGQNPFLILAQQAPQVSNALEGTAGVAGRLATFFSGPWGAALLAAGSVAAILASKLELGGKAASQHRDAATDLTDALKKLDEQSGRNAKSSEQLLAIDINAAVAATNLALAKRQEALARLEALKAQQQEDLANARAGSPDPNRQFRLQNAPAEIARTEAEITRLQNAIAGVKRSLDYAITAGKRMLDESKGTVSGIGRNAAAAGKAIEAVTAESTADIRLKNVADGSTVMPDLVGQQALVDLDAVAARLLDISATVNDIDVGAILPEEEARRLERFVVGFNGDLSDGLADAVIYGEDLGDALVNSLKRAAAEALSSGLFDLLTGKTRGGGGNFLGTLFGGFFANGGNPPVGKASIVGERGPEIFVPKAPGTIIPNHALGGGPIVNINVDARFASEGTAALIERRLVEVAPTIIAAAQQTTIRTINRPRI